jgi:hypothetical protein
LCFLVITKSKKQVSHNLKKKRSKKTNNGTRRNTYESMRSNISTPSSRQGATAAEVFYAEVLEEATSSTHFLFLFAPVSSDSAAGGDVVELVPSSESLASSPSWVSSASGASDTTAARSAESGPPSGRGGIEMRNTWS